MKTNGQPVGKGKSGIEKPGNEKPGIEKPKVTAAKKYNNGAPIDWQNVHQVIAERASKLAAMEDAPAQDLLEQYWARRAEQIARAIEEEDQGEQIELALVRLGYEIYGIDVQYVYEIRRVDRITRVPRVPEWVAGVVNLRGKITSALDLRRFLGLTGVNGETDESGQQHLVVVEVPEMELALVVDEVLHIDTLPISRLQEPTSAIRGIPNEYIRGVIVRSEDENENGDGDGDGRNPSGTLTAAFQIPMKREGMQIETNHNLMVILDLPAILRDKRIIVHEEVL